jgi:hypothetical protein
MVFIREGKGHSVVASIALLRMTQTGEPTRKPRLIALHSETGIIDTRRDHASEFQRPFSQYIVRRVIALVGRSFQ